jgi:hypothetical protein
MKSALAILFSLSLVWGQAVAQTMPSCAERTTCACCNCGKACCVGKQAARSEPLSAAPQSSTQQNQTLFLVLANRTFVIFDTTPSEVFLPFSSPLMASAVPLFQQNCALLI